VGGGGETFMHYLITSFISKSHTYIWILNPKFSTLFLPKKLPIELEFNWPWFD